jgi:hypothetical protein
MSKKKEAELLNALASLIRSFPTDDDLKMAGWSDEMIEAACDAYDHARAVERKHTGAQP